MGLLIYKPIGRSGYTCTAVSAAERSLRVDRAALDQEVTADGDEPLTSNRSLVRSITAYGDAEMTKRRTRSDQRRDEFAAIAERYRREATNLLDLLDDVGKTGVQEWCSACLALTTHLQVDRGTLIPSAYICQGENCGAATTECAAPRCEHMGIRSARNVGMLRFCAEHRHAIPSFKTLDERLQSLDEYEAWLDFDSRNAKMVTTVALGTVGGALVLGPLAYVAAPAIGGIVGSTGGLAGAAATSHGLALLGGGSLAAGGAGMAGGTAVIAAVGTALGGPLGASVVSAYTGSDRSFKVERLASGTGPTVVVASGFLTEAESGWGGWERIVDERYPDATVFRVQWGAKELRALASMIGLGAGKGGALKLAMSMAAAATKKAASKLGPLGSVLAATDVAKNPWSVAKARAEMTGAVLADLIARTDETDYVLIGHSLGARVMLDTVHALGSRAANPQVTDVHLLGAAVGRDRVQTDMVEKAVVGTLNNYFSNNDTVLAKAYTTAQLGQKAGGAVGFNAKSPKVQNRDVSKRVDSHSDYVNNVRLA